MAPRKRTKYPHGIHPDALPQAEGFTLHFDPRGLGRWEVRYYEEGRRKAKGIGNSGLSVRQLHDAFYTFVDGSSVDTLEALSKEFHKTQEFKDLADNTRRGYLENHKAIMNFPTRSGKFGRAKLGKIKVATVREYRDSRSKQTESRAAAEVRYLKRLFNWALEMELMTANPAKPIRIKGLTRARLYYVQDSDYLAMLNLAPLKVALIAHLAYLTGRRRTDILNIKRPDLTKDGVAFIENKTGKHTTVEWSGELRQTIELAKEEGGDFWLFEGDTGERYSDSAFKSAWGRLRTAMKEVKATPFQFKDIRKKHATEFEEAGGDATDNLAHGRRSTTDGHYITRKKVKSLR